MRLLWLIACCVLAGTAPTLAVAPLRGELPTGNAVIRGKVGDSEIVITTTTRLAGAIHSLTWAGKEFIDSADHGRQLQSASNLDCGKRFIPEVFNPTEAGSRFDGAGPRSSSKLLRLHANKNELTSLTQMAFWLRPGERSAGHLAYNGQVLSNHLLARQIRIGYKNMPHVLDYRVTFTLPPGEKHTLAQFEALTGYMPAEFSAFWSFNTKTGKLDPLSDGPGEQPQPVVLATPDGRFAMGVFCPARQDQARPGYGRWRFVRERVVKWNCVYRVTHREGVAAGDYVYRMLVIVGTLATVEETLRTLHAP